MNYFFEVLLF